MMIGSFPQFSFFLCDFSIHFLIYFYIHLLAFASSAKIILIVILTVVRPMSKPFPNKSKPSRKDKSKKQQQPQENETQVLPALAEVQFPSHLHEVNFFSMDTFESCVEDTLTNEIFHEAIMENQHLFAGKTVLHLTDGINLLYSIFAVRAGSRKIHCVIIDKSSREKQNVFMMQQIIKENKLEGHIQVSLWKDFNAKIDVIIAEPMGYCLHFDGLIDKVIQARDKFLNPKGIILPNTLSYKCALLYDQHFSQERVGYWDDIYGVPMTTMKKWISHQPVIRTVDPNLTTSRVANLLSFNLEIVKYEDIVKVDKIVEIDMQGTCKVNGLVTWFEICFDHCQERKQLNGTPWGESTKYTQLTLYWPEVVELQGGKYRLRLKGERKSAENYTVISTEIAGKVYQYTFS